MNTPEQDMQDRAMSYSLDDDEVTLTDDERFERLLAAEEKRQREVVRKACLQGLLELGILPRSLVRERP